MALIGKIRSRMWIVFVIIALALLSFILMDAQGPGGGSAGNTTLGVVNGKKIDYKDFDLTERVLFTNSTQEPLMRRAGLWDYFVTKTIVEDESSEIGLNVSKNELMELQFGQSLSPIIYQNYRNPQTGLVDIAQLTQIKNSIVNNQEMNPGFRQYWAEQEKQVISTQLQTKLNTLVQKGIYTPTWLAEESYKNGNGTIDIEVVKIPFDNISAENVKLTDADFKAYINDHRQDFERKQETRIVDYVSMDVIPNSRDSAVWREEMQNLIADFIKTENDSLFSFANNGNYQNYYAKPEEIQEKLRNVVPTMKIGEVHGPFISLRNLQAVKLIDRRVIPDSVSASHILIRAEEGNVTQLNRANELVDSLQLAVLSGSKFADLASKFSEDLSNNNNGGDLGYFGQGLMVPTFNNICFVTGRTGGVYKTRTQFGVHLIKVNDRVFNNRTPKHKLAYINIPIVPTKETQDGLYESMVDLVGSYSYLDGLIEKVNQTANLEITSSNPLLQNDYSIDQLGPGNTTRDIVKFAFSGDAELGDLSPEVYTYTDKELYYNKKYVAAGLSRIQEPGLPSAEEIRDNIESVVLNNKKAAHFINELSGKTISEIAADSGVEIDTILRASLNSVFVAGLGNEPKVMGRAYNLGIGESSAPIIGESGVFLVRKIKDNPSGEPSGLVGVKSSMSLQEKNLKGFKLINAIKEKSTIKDYRTIFF